MKLWQAYAMGAAVAERHPGIIKNCGGDCYSHAVLIATGEPLCKRVKAFSLCWDMSLLRDKPPTCPACQRAIKRLESRPIPAAAK